MVKISFPNNFLLQSWIVWILIQCSDKIAYEINFVDTWQHHIRNFFAGLVLSWICGSIWSDFVFLSWFSICVNIYIVWVILFKKHNLIKNLKIWIWLLFVLAMFTIWVEPCLTLVLHASPEALISYAFPVLAPVLFIFDIGFSVVWCYLTILICNNIDSEF